MIDRIAASILFALFVVWVALTAIASWFHPHEVMQGIRLFFHGAP